MAASTFISYSNLDRAVAEALCAALEASGTRCWIAPRDISPSKEWAEEIIDGINGAQVMLLVFSSHSNGSPQVRREIERAVHKEVPVIPFRIENVTPTKSLEYFLSAQHWFDAFDAPVAAYLPRLCQVIGNLCAAGVRRGGVTDTARADTSQPFTGNPYANQPAAPATAYVAAAAPSLAPAAGFAEADLALLASELASRIGPIARLLVKKAAARSPDHRSLIDALASELDLPVERTAFVAACRQRLGR